MIGAATVPPRKSSDEGRKLWLPPFYLGRRLSGSPVPRLLSRSSLKPFRAAWRRALTADEGLTGIALQKEQAGQVGVVKAAGRGGPDHRLGMVGHAKSGGAQHGKVIGAVANRRALVRDSAAQ